MRITPEVIITERDYSFSSKQDFRAAGFLPFSEMFPDDDEAFFPVIEEKEDQWYLPSLLPWEASIWLGDKKDPTYFRMEMPIINVAHNWNDMTTFIDDTSNYIIEESLSSYSTLNAPYSPQECINIFIGILKQYMLEVGIGRDNMGEDFKSILKELLNDT